MLQVFWKVNKAGAIYLETLGEVINAIKPTSLDYEAKDWKQPNTNKTWRKEQYIK